MKGDGPAPVDLDPGRIDRWQAAILDLVAQANYAIDPDWALPDSFMAYRERWTSSTQPKHFLDALRGSLSDERTIAEAWVDDDRLVGFLWVTFTDVAGYGATIADVKHIALAFTHRDRGLGHQMLEHAGELAAARGAKVIRGEIRADNMSARRAIEAAGARPARIIYERLLDEA